MCAPGLAVHKSAETFAIGVKLVNTNISSRKWVWLMLTYSAITPLGIVTGTSYPVYLLQIEWCA
jgi:zinc transporter ZupT